MQVSINTPHMDKKDIQRQSENVYDISEYGLLAKPVCMYINDL